MWKVERILLTNCKRLFEWAYTYKYDRFSEDSDKHYLCFIYFYIYFWFVFLMNKVGVIKLQSITLLVETSRLIIYSHQNNV